MAIGLSMVNYNYLDLTPVEFEELSRDILQVREDLIFESFNSNKDRGIDFRYQKDGIFIMLQAKRYEHYSDLKRALVHNEIVKIKRKKPTRYILTTAVDLTVTQKEELADLLEDFVIQESDILGKKDLNNLLGLSQYTNVRKLHYKLWLTSTNTLTDILDQVVYRKEYNLARSEWDTIHKESKYYVQNKSFLEALDRIEEHRIVLISGTPGSGKTTLARALVSYFHAREGFHELIYVRDTDQAWSMLKEGQKQIFFYDDFLGAIRFSGFGKNEEVILTKLIERINSMPDKVLVLTTREYVLRQAELVHSELKKELYNLSKCIVNPETYSDFIKAKILYNHLYFSGLHSNQILTLTSEKNYHTIVQHPNYTPRLVASFIKFASNNNDKRGEQFYQGFEKYLDHPREFWKDIYEKQSSPARLLLVVMFSLNDPIYLPYLKKAYDCAIDIYVRKFNDVIIAPDTLENILKELSDTFISIDLEEDEWQHRIQFQNPSIKDFLLEYLRGKEDLIAIILESAFFLNQFTFAFDTKVSSIEDEDAEYPLDGKKIIVKGDLFRLFRDSFLQKFDTLYVSTIEPAIYTDQKTFRHSPEELLTLKLIELKNLFGMQDKTVREFIIEKFKQILLDYENNSKKGFAKILEREAMLYFPSIVKMIQPYVDISPEYLLMACYNSITFASEFIVLHGLGDLYPEEFKKLLKKEGRKIGKSIKKLLIDDIIYFEEEGMDFESDMVIDQVYKEVFKLYDLKITDAFTKRLFNVKVQDGERPSRKEQREWQAERKKERKEVEKTKKDIDQLFASLKNNYICGTFQSERELNSYLKKMAVIHGKALVDKIKQRNSPLIEQFLEDELLVSLLITYFKTYPSIPEKLSAFWQQMYDILFDLSLSKQVFSKEDLLAHLSSTAITMLITGEEEFNEKTNRNATWKPHAFEAIPASFFNALHDLVPFFLKDGQWFRFTTDQFRIYLAAIGISRMDKTEKKAFYAQKMSQDEMYSFIINDNFELWRFLLELDRTDFTNYYVLPALNRFMNRLDFSDEKAIVLSYSKMLDIVLMLVLDDSGFLRMQQGHSSCSEETGLISLLDADCDWFNWDGYLFSDYIDEKELESNKHLYLAISDYIKSHCSQSSGGTYILKMAPQLEDPVFFNFVKELGIVAYIAKAMEHLKDKIYELQEKAATC